MLFYYVSNQHVKYVHTILIVFQYLLFLNGQPTPHYLHVLE